MRRTYKAIPLRLIEVRTEKGWTQAEVAERIGVDTNTVSRWERGETFPNSHARKKLTEIYGKSLEELEFFKQARIKKPSSSQISPTIPYTGREKAGEKPKYETIKGIPVIERDQDIEKILHRLQQKEARFLTIVAPPGMGKTEVAEQVRDEARRQEKFRYVRFLYFEDETDNKKALEKVDQGIRDLSRDTCMLLIIDNCEQLKGLTRDLEKLIEEHEQLSILATSRSTMSLQEHLLLPLTFPKDEFEPLHTYGSVQLLLASANVNGKVLELTQENTKTIVEICRAFAGLPMALLMAGSWIKELSVERMLEQINTGEIQSKPYLFADTEPEHHITLQALIAWSYNCLDEQEQKIFRRLNIITGSCTRELVARVCNLGDLTKPVEDLLAGLEKHHLITRTKERIRYAHKTLRDFATTLMYTEFQEELKEVSDQFMDDYHEFLNYYHDLDQLLSEGRSEEEIKPYLERFLSRMSDIGGTFDV